jgi:hypothetical protein
MGSVKLGPGCGEMDMSGSIFSGALALAMVVAGAASAQPNVAGVWHVSGKIVYGNRFFEATPTCNFMQSGAQISGTCTGLNATGPIKGVVSGNSVAWTWQNHATDSVGVNGMTGFNGTIVNAGLIRGTMTSTASAGKGTFTQTR